MRNLIQHAVNVSNRVCNYKSESRGGGVDSSNRMTNKLGSERSPYLLQHASNPVHWYPWGSQAFEAAKESNKLIFLSVGYSTCHWCHVMERESFENPEVAEIMNEHFINVKVDREERPDVDKVYMSFVQATTGGGGWPMSVFLTPKLKPIYGGTYFPPQDSVFGRPGFKTILRALSSKWEMQREQMMESGDRIIEALEASKQTQGTDDETPPECKEVVKTCFRQLSQSYDSEYGGFSKEPKFPQPVNFNFLFSFYAGNRSDARAKQGLEMTLHTLKMMAKGGIHDHISQGFARYSTDGKWHVPHFEKMLYDQGQLAVAYAYAFQATGDPEFSTIVEDILTYVSRDLSHPLGAFYSAEDADSKDKPEDDHKREGAFCVWTHEQLNNLLKQHTFKGKDGQEQDLMKLCETYFNVESDGNCDPRKDPHGELKSQNVLTVMGTDIDQLKEDFGLDSQQLKEKIGEIQRILYAERQKRPRPHLDDKILTSWNGLMISGYAVSGMALQNPDFVKRAVRAAEFLQKHMFHQENHSLLRSVYTEGSEVKQLGDPIHGFMDDYAFLIRGLLDLYEATFEAKWVEWADKLQKKQNELFWDATGHGYFTAPEGDESIVIRLKEDQDGAEPSGNSVSCLNLLRLAAYTENSDYKLKAGQVINAYKSTLEGFPVALPEMTCALIMLQNPPPQIIISGKDPKELIKTAQTALLPQKILLRADEKVKNSIFYQKLDILKSIPTQENKAYLCQNYACSEPVSNSEELKKLLNA